MNKVVITGGNGFVGSHITECFKAKGVNILHPTSKELDIADKKALVAAFSGADTVIHNASYAADWGKASKYQEVNLEGTKNVLEACLTNGVSKVILTGSCSVYGEDDHPEPKTEDSPHNSHYKYFMDRVFPSAMNLYRDSKKAQTDFALDFAKNNSLNLTIIHPVWVYGERELGTGFLEYLRTVKSGLPMIMGSKKNIYHVVYAKDLAKAYYLAYKKRDTAIAEYIVGNPQTVNMNDFYRLFCTTAGFRKPANIPKAIIYPIAFMMELAATIFNKKTPPLLTRGRVNMFYDSIAYDTKKAQKELGFDCHYTLEQGMTNTIKWYREIGYL